VRESLEVPVADRRSIADGQVEDRAAAFTRLAEGHLDASYRLARAILRDPAEAEDATHDAYVQAWRKWSTLRDPSRFEAWFDRILVNTCRNRLQHSSRWQARDISGEILVMPGDPYRQTVDRDVIGGALLALSPDHRIVVTLRYFLDLAIEDIAARLGVPAGTVQSRLHYALQRLQSAIDPADAGGSNR